MNNEVNKKMPNPLVSIIILNWNGNQDVIDTISELRKQTYTNYEIIVVDQNSKDESANEIEKNFPHVKIIRLRKNLGVPGGRNVGILHTEGDIIFSLDNDAVLEKTALQKIVERFSIDIKLGIIGCKVLDYHTKNMNMVSWIYPKFQLKNAEAEFETYIFPGGAHAMRKNVIDRIGLYDKDLFFAREEEGIALRCLDAGYKIIYFPAAVVFHKLHLKKRNYYKSKRFFLNTRNRLWITWKYLPTLPALKRTSIIVIGLFIKSIKNFVLSCYLEAVFAALRNIPNIIRNRRPISMEGYKKYTSLEQSKRGSLFFRFKYELFSKI